MLTDEQLQLAKRLKADFPLFAKHCLKVRTKAKGIEPLVLNSTQRYIHERIEQQRARTGKVRAMILKGRQQGASTYTEGRYYWRTATAKGVRAFILAHDQSASDNLFEMAVRYHDHMPEELKPSTSSANAKELLFGKLDSGYKVATAGTKAVGRSGTVQFFHGSEVAYWPNAETHMEGVGQAVPDLDDTEIILESTANGVGNLFHRMWLAAEAGTSDYIAIFVPWFWQEEYRRETPDGFEPTKDERTLMALYGLDLEQIAWRRNKIATDFVGDESRFRQEYPNNSNEAFVESARDVYLSTDDIMAARKCVMPDSVGPLVLGVDPARFGDDRTGVAWRRGRRLFKLAAWSKLDTMQVAGRLVQIIKTDRPDRIFIDVGGLGAGVVDRLNELGYGRIVSAVNFGGKAIESDRYRNKRAEMYGRCKEWLAAAPASIPDSDALMADLLAPGYSYDSNGRVVIEPKEDIKDRLGRSPDIGDATVLTFAEDVAMPEETAHGGRGAGPADSVGGY